MKFFLLSCFFLLFPILLFSQYDIAWFNGFGGAQRDYPASMAMDQNGNVYIAGSFQATVDVDPGAGVANLTSDGFYDAFVVKYDFSGNYVWSFKIGNVFLDDGLSITIDDASGHLYLAGAYTIGPVDLDPSPSGSFILPAPAAFAFYETFIAKYDLNGNFVCGRKFEGIAGPSSNYPLTLSNVVNGEFIIGGYYAGTIEFNTGGTSITHTPVGNGDMYFAKLDTNCNVLWVNSVGGKESERLHSVEQAPNGDVFIGGTFQDTVDFDPQGTSNIKTSTDGYDIFYAKYDAAGNHLWAQTLGGTTGSASDILKSLTLDNNGDLIICGHYHNTVDFDPGPGISNLTGVGPLKNAFIGKYSGATGSLVWIKGVYVNIIEEVELFSVSINKQTNNVFALGMYVGGSNIFYADSNKFQLTRCGSGGFSTAFFFTHYDNVTGNVLCANALSPCMALGGTNVKDKSIRIYNDDAIFLTGVYTADSICISPCNNPSVIPTSYSSDADVFVARFDIPPPIQSSISAAKDTICFGDSLLLTASGGQYFLWNNGTTTASFMSQPSSTTTYSVIVSDGCSCAIPDTSFFTLNVITLYMDISGDSVICVGDTAHLQATGAGYYLWSTGDTTNEIKISPTGNTVYTVENASGLCSAIADSFLVMVIPSPTAYAGPDVTILKGNNTLLSCSETGTYNWTPPNGLSCTTCCSPVAAPETTTTYTLTVFISEDCFATDYVTVFVEEPIECKDAVFIPSAFSPNADGENDFLTLFSQGSSITSFYLTIYNRWGEKIFETNNPNDSWNGNHNNLVCQSGVYFYILKMRCISDNSDFVKQGNISLLR